MGQVIAVTKCPWHPDNTPSLAIYKDGYYCFGCKKSGKLEPWMTDLVSKEDNRDVSRRSIDISKFTYTYEDEHKEFLGARNIPTTTALEYGMSARQNQFLIPAYDFDGHLHGYQIRNITGKPKYKSLPLQGQYAKYSWVDYIDGVVPITTGKLSCCIVESVVDALYMSQLNIPSLALLGTNIPMDIIPFFEKLKIYIVFDPDAIVIASYLQEVIGSYGIDVEVIDLPDAPYKVPIKEIENKILGGSL